MECALLNLPQDEQALVDWAQAQGLTVYHRFANRLLVNVEAPLLRYRGRAGGQNQQLRDRGASYYSNDRNPAVPAALGSIVHSVGGLNNIQVMKAGNHGFPAPVFPVYSTGRPSAVGESASHAGTAPSWRENRVHQPELRSGRSLQLQCYDTAALDNLGHCCNVYAVLFAAGGIHRDRQRRIYKQ